MQASVARLRVAVVAMLTLFLSGCASLGGRAPHIEGIADTVYYVSARARHEGRDSRELATTLEYGLAVMRRHRGSPDDRGASRDIIDSTIVDSLTFVRHLRERLTQQAAPYDFAVLYVHGMGTSLHEAWQHTAAARGLAERDVPWIVFAWPSAGAPVTWPTGDAVFTAAYRRDSVMAQRTSPFLQPVLATVLEAMLPTQLVLASHSLGGQLVGESLRRRDKVSDALRAQPLRAVAFLMPDVSTVHFRDSIVPAFVPLAQRRVLYVSRNDRVLTLARLADGSARTGLRTRPAWVAPDTAHWETVDVTRARTTEGWFQQRFGTHHAIKRQRGLFADLVHIVGAQRAADCRERAAMATRSAEGVFELWRVPLPLEALAACDAVARAPQ